ncbi:2-amino-4-hydroxy-6-hydroxymethyldihydropteridine diphosphokinase [Dokdonella sp.]|uniref:2-amino-4-hydroxy-6- hydroxymethyldihydropteridine diphosphokinase n=1 Tax=Dokdonella sp. TaxID=2291710 RepID=UPI003C47338C
MSAVLAYVGLGSNLGEPRQQLASALEALDDIDETRVLRQSSFYRSKPWGILEQPDFLNAVAELETRLDPVMLLEELLAVERKAGRQRDSTRWGPRIIDLDLLIYGMQQIRQDGIEVPHPRLFERSFVVLPLAELRPDLIVPGHGPIADAVAMVDSGSCLRLALDEG